MRLCKFKIRYQLILRPDHVTEALLSNPLAGHSRDMDLYRQIISDCTLNEQRHLLQSVMRITSRRLPTTDKIQSSAHGSGGSLKVLQGTAALLSELTADNQVLSEYLCEWLASSSAAGVDQGITLYRAIIAVIARSKGDLPVLLARKYVLRHFRTVEKIV